jgi:NACHT domain
MDIPSFLQDPAVMEAATKGFVMSFGKVGGEAILKLLGKGGEKIEDEAGNIRQEITDFLFPIVRDYIKNYADRHGTFNVLGMGKPVSLESVYTQVNFHPEIIKTYESVDAQETAFRDRESRNDDRRAGMEVANTHQYLMVLGGPGMGKTTFLRKVGLEALKQAQGQYSHSCIPVFLELRKFKWKESDNIDLEAKIAEEFQHCGLPEYESSTKKFLEEGRLLILFDGLDEVPPELLGQMTTAIKNLVDRYSKNRFIASCRIAAYRNYQNFSRFTDVAIADFDEEQIQCFINNWFKSHDRSEWGEECWSRLNSNDHKATRELAKNPLLLTLICILFRKQGELPTRRSTLYDRAVSTLLSEWDASKAIVRQQPYKGLDLKCKEVMLAEIAYSNFITNNLFFQQGEIAKQIEQILLEMLTDEKRINGRDVLRAVEEQHGILVNRYEDIYSFSHLTLQEFLTAKHIIDNNLNLTDLVTQHLCDKRWREVFLLLAGLRKADDLLLTIEQQIRTYVATPNLQNLLVWVGEVTNTLKGDIQDVSKRAIAIVNSMAITYSIAIGSNISMIIGIPQAVANAYVTTNTIIINDINSFDVFLDTDIFFDSNNLFSKAYSIAKSLNYTYTLTGDFNAIDELIEYARWSAEANIYQGVDLQDAIDSLKRLQSEIPSENQPREIHQVFGRKLIEIWLNVYHLTPELVNLSQNEISALDNYLYANLLLIECERAAVRRTPEVWSQIESRMLRLA